MPTVGDRTEPSVVGPSNPGDSPVTNQVFSMFKSYLDEKSKQIEWKSEGLWTEIMTLNYMYMWANF